VVVVLQAQQAAMQAEVLYQVHCLVFRLLAVAVAVAVFLAQMHQLIHQMMRNKTVNPAAQGAVALDIDQVLPMPVAQERLDKVLQAAQAAPLLQLHHCSPMPAVQAAAADLLAPMAHIQQAQVPVGQGELPLFGQSMVLDMEQAAEEVAIGLGLVLAHPLYRQQARAVLVTMEAVQAVPVVHMADLVPQQHPAQPIKVAVAVDQAIPLLQVLQLQLQVELAAMADLVWP
jgi:hypothetical protein